MHFAKLYTVWDHQILFTKSYQTEKIGEKTYGISYWIALEMEENIEGRYWFDTMEEMEKQWGNITEEKAVDVFNSSLKFFRYEKN